MKIAKSSHFRTPKVRESVRGRVTRRVEGVDIRQRGLDFLQLFANDSLDALGLLTDVMERVLCRDDLVCAQDARGEDYSQRARIHSIRVFLGCDSETQISHYERSKEVSALRPINCCTFIVILSSKHHYFTPFK